MRRWRLIILMILIYFNMYSATFLRLSTLSKNHTSSTQIIIPQIYANHMTLESIAVNIFK